MIMRVMKLSFLHSRNLAAFVCVYKLVIALGRFSYRVGGIKVCFQFRFRVAETKRYRARTRNERNEPFYNLTGIRKTRSSSSTMARTSSGCNWRFYRVVKLQCCELSNCSVLALQNHHSGIARTRQKRILTVCTFFVQTDVSLVRCWCMGHCDVVV